MRIDKTEVFTFEELSESAQALALEKNWDINLDSDWFDWVYEGAKELFACLGVEVENIYFSGFSSQGDGACFEGSYKYRKGSVEALQAMGVDSELLDIAKRLQAIQKANFYQLYASTCQQGHYMHSGCMAVNVDRDSDNYQGMTDSAEEDITEAMHDLADWLYRALEREHDWLVSDEQVRESIIANDLEFTADGNLY